MTLTHAQPEAGGGPAPPGLVGWAVASGGGGHQVQCVGVLEALDIEPVIMPVAPGPPWRWVAPWGPAAPDARFGPPWPDLVVAAGRQAIPYARKIRGRSGGRSFVVALQTPGIAPSNFDLVWVPEHDRLRGENVIVTPTAPHRLSPNRLEEAAARHRAEVADLPRPLVAVLVGGASRAYRFGPSEAERLAADLRRLAMRTGCGLLVTPSRRTGAEQTAILGAELADLPGRVWTGEGENPYFAYLGLADAIIATCDSTNMIGEAAFTGKPVHAYRLPGGNGKFERFHEAMTRHGALRWFDGDLEEWTYQPLDATRTVAAAVQKGLEARRAQRA